MINGVLNMSSATPLESDGTGFPSLLSPYRRAVGWALGLLLALSAGMAGRAWVVPTTVPARASVGLVQDAVSAQPATPVPLQQFTAHGHILGFGVGQVYLASGSHALQVAFVGAQPVVPQSDRAGGDGQQRAAPALAEARYPDLWPGIDLSYRAAPGGITESVWRVAPGADLAQVRLRYNRPLALNPDGSLAIRYDTGVLSESAPVAWQERDGKHQPVTVAFALNGDYELGFTLGEYDSSLPVVIDPTLTWNTFLGGTGYNAGLDIAVDGSGNIYVSGTSGKTWGNPVRPFIGGQESFPTDSNAFVAKLDSNGTLIWNTFLGGKGEKQCC